MRRTDNPFSIRRSESIDSIPIFLNLFEPGVLDILDRQRWSENVLPIRSARGGGKTSLLRLFTPAVLHNLHLRRQEEPLKELYRSMRDFGALGENGPRVLGVMLMCGRNYEMLEDLGLEEGRRMRLFFGLLNARIVLATLRASMELLQLSYPQDVGKLEVEGPADGRSIPGIAFPCSGKELLRWSAALESELCDSLDSFGPLKVSSLSGHDELFSLSLIRPEGLRMDGRPIAERTLLMMDDIHKLTSTQRGRLVETVIESRSQVGVWIAERFEALSTDEMLATGAAEGRDYHPPVAIEHFWRKNYKTFEKYAMRIGEKRVRNSPAGVEDFRSCLATSLDSGPWEEPIRKAAETVRLRVAAKVGSAARYREWFESTDSLAGTTWEKARAWRSLEILIARQEARRQRVLFDDALPAEQLDKESDSSVGNAAELFLAKEFGLPYYFGPEKIARLASLNIQQFLGLSSGLFEDVLSASLLEQSTTIPPERQHALLKTAAKSLWEELPRSIKHGRAVQNLLDGIGRYARAYTYRPTAPNDPGVAGTAIRMSERTQLLDRAMQKTRPDYARLANALASAIAHNLLVPDLDMSCKGERWMVLNLNRLLCVHYDLPLGYGLFKEQPARTLHEWLDRPYQSNQAELF